MTYAWGKTSQYRRKGVHPYLLLVTDKVLKHYDLTIMWMGGVRTAGDQGSLYAIGRTTELDRKPVTTKDGLNKRSKHQIQKDGYAHALDLSPFPLDLGNQLKAKARYYMMWGALSQAWAELLEEGKVTGSLRWGGDWDGDGDFKDQSFDDLPHIEWVP